MMKRLITGLVLLTASAAGLAAQNILPNTWRDLEYRAQALRSQAGSLMWRTRPELRKEGLDLYPLHLFGSWNSHMPSGWADGVLWQGKGLNALLSAGAGFTGNFWSLYLAPEITIAQNLDFPLNPFTSYPLFGDAHGNVWDHPNRFGSDSLFSLYPGQSGAEVFWGPFRLSAGTENLIWGSSRYNGMLLSSQGPGVPKVEVALDPWTGEAGTVEAHLLYGYLQPSQWAPVTAKSGERFWGALFLGYSPSFLPQLTLGAGRTVLSYWQDLKWQDFVMPYSPGLNFGVDEYDQRISLTYRWREPSVGFEVYGEWGRNDFSPSLTAWLLNTEHTQSWVLGLRKIHNFDVNKTLYLEAEIAVLSLGVEGFINENGYNAQGADFYTHWLIRQGYTVSGQDLGAAVGNGNMQMLGIFYLGEKEFAGYELRRWVKDYAVLVTDPRPGEEHQINVAYEHELRGGIRQGPWEVSGSAALIADINRYFERKDVYSFSGNLALRWEF